MRALIIGDVHIIAAGRSDRFPDPGANVILSNGYSAVSGVASNIAYDLAGLGVDVILASAVGRDSFGDAVIGDLRERGIDVQHIQRSEGPTGVFLIVVDDTGERTMLGFRGAMDAFTLEPNLLESVRPHWIHASGYTMLNPWMRESYRELVQQAKAQGVSCSVELEGIAQAGIQIDLTDLTVFCNRHEHRLYFGSGEPAWPEGSERLVVKAGKEGCFLAEREGVLHIPALPAEVRDLTGAGDAFNAAFIAARLTGRPANEACRWGNAAGSLKVAVRGPRVDMTAEQVRKRAGHDYVAR